VNIGIYIYDQAEVLDFSGPFEVFSTASRISEEGDPFKVFLISEQGGQVVARAGYTIISDYAFNQHPDLDVLIISGGVHGAEMQKPQVLDWIARQAETVSLMTSVCTGAFLLAKAGVITDHDVTTHWEDIAELQRKFPSLNVIRGVRWVDDGEIVTSGGISAGMDMSLHLVSKLHSFDLAEATATQMELSWNRNIQE
jgi:transcriptional regulator GlxA family with amidase domain